MFRRFLSLLGLSWYIPTPPATGEGSVIGPDTDGQATVSFTPGKVTAFSSEEVQELHDKRRDRITDDNLVWPGKTDTIHIGNNEPLANRFELSVTDLDPAYYMQRPPVGGAWQPEGGVLLQPGEEATFEVVFLPPLVTEKAKTRFFHYVLSRFDPRRIDEPGDVLEDVPMRWVSLPAQDDLKITAQPKEIVIRPWRRTALFHLQFQNRSYLPPSVQLQIHRAPTKQALEKEAEPVGTLSQSLASRTPGVWHCLLPPAGYRGSYFATVTGTARVADNVEHALTLPGPVTVRYIPWLRLGRDWAFLCCTLFCLMWLFWGIPVWKAPTVPLKLKFPNLEAGQPPPGTQWEQLGVSAQLVNDRGSGGDAIQGVLENDGVFRFNLPPHLYGYRWPFFGWNGCSLETQRFKIKVSPRDKDKPLDSRYDLTSVKSDEEDPDFFTLKGEERPFLGEWVTRQRLGTVRANEGIFVNIFIDDLGAARGKTENLNVSCIMGGQSRLLGTYLVLQGAKVPLVSNLDLKAQPGRTQTVEIMASTPDNRLQTRPWIQDLTPRKDPIAVHLTFPKEMPPNTQSGKTPEQLAQEQAAEREKQTKALRDAKEKKERQELERVRKLREKQAKELHDEKVEQDISYWCTLLHLPQAADALFKEQNRSNALHVEMKVIHGLEKNNFSLVVTANKACYFQIYEYKEKRKEAWGILGKGQNYSPEGDIPAAAWLLKPDTPIPIHQSDTGSEKDTRSEYVLLAVLAAPAKAGAPVPKEMPDTLLDRLNENNTKGMAITGTKRLQRP